MFLVEGPSRGVGEETGRAFAPRVWILTRAAPPGKLWIAPSGKPSLVRAVDPWWQSLIIGGFPNGEQSRVGIPQSHWFKPPGSGEVKEQGEWQAVQFAASLSGPQQRRST